MEEHKAFVRALAPSGNLFLLITLQELRRQGLSYLAFYALQRIVDEGEFAEWGLCGETGLADYEISRACKLLAKSDLIEITKLAEDRRVKILTPTKRGRQVVSRIMAKASDRLEEGIPAPGRPRRLKEAAAFLHRASEKLRGPLQLQFFDSGLEGDPPRRKRKKRSRGVSA